MTELFEQLDTLKQLHQLYAEGSLSEQHFEQRIAQLELMIAQFEQDLEDEFDNVPV